MTREEIAAVVLYHANDVLSSALPELSPLGHHDAVIAIASRVADALATAPSAPTRTRNEIAAVVRESFTAEVKPSDLVQSHLHDGAAGCVAGRVADRLGDSVAVQSIAIGPADINAIVGAAAMESLAGRTQDACMRVADRATARLIKAMVAAISPADAAIIDQALESYSSMFKLSRTERDDIARIRALLVTPPGVAQ